VTIRPVIESAHFLDMLLERAIRHEWVERTMQVPDQTEDRDDGTRHFLKRIPEHGDRWLRVVVNVVEEPNRFVTVFFDRRLKAR